MTGGGSGNPSIRRTWLLPLSILLGAAVTLFLVTVLVDAAGRKHPLDVLALVYQPNPWAARGTLSNAAEVVAAVLAIAITVVAIVVELAANRYTHRITELFVSAPTNFAVMGFFVVTALMCLWVALTFDIEAAHTQTRFVPYFGTAVAVGMLALCLLLLLPYFAFVFAFLDPAGVVERIRRHTIHVVAKKRARKGVANAQREAVRGVEQIADVGLNAMEHKDKGVSMASVNALHGMVKDYREHRGELPEDWFRVEGWLANNPDFVSMAPDVLANVSRRQIWFEMKVLRQYQTLYSEALNRMRDVNYLIAINTRQIAEDALRRGDRRLYELAIKFLNTYLRATINARDVRTAYNVLNQYRLLAEALLGIEQGTHAVEIARYFKYYGLIGYNAKLPFVLETVAYDLCRLNEAAYDQGSPASSTLLRIFLQVDKESETPVQETSLRGVRKAQVKLATHYLLHGDRSRAERVYHDMKDEEPHRLASIRDELLDVHSPEFWEINDRGVNFDYLSAERKDALMDFFSWFADRVPEPRASVVPKSPSEVVPSGGRKTEERGDPSLHDVPGAGPDPATAEDANRE